MDQVKQDLNGVPPPYTEQPEAPLCQNEQCQYTMYPNCVPPQNPQILCPQRIPASACQGYPFGHPQSFCPQGIPASAFQKSPAGHLSPTLNGQVQTTIAMTQPGRYFPAEIYRTLPPNYLGLSLLSCILCFGPLGYIAVATSCEVDDAIRRGDVAAANKASRSAKRLAYFNIALGVVAVVIASLLIVFLH